MHGGLKRDLVTGLPVVEQVQVEPPVQRKFLPSLSDLVDRLTIVQMKAVFIPEQKDKFLEERAAIEHDIDLIIQEKEITIGAAEIHAIIVIMLANRWIWENESKIRNATDKDHETQLARLKATHAINGVRNAAKNELSAVDGGRLDYKLDCLAADLPPEFGNWKIF